MIDITLTVNNELVQAQVLPVKTLMDFLRDDLGLKGTINGCYSGHCGACTIILDGIRQTRFRRWGCQKQTKHRRSFWYLLNFPIRSAQMG
ncbi:MAG: 2Fe-2S iron-sulfur cluster-binding protein [Anaerolineales bacterium]